jgi:Tol biopolymer transport system component
MHRQRKIRAARRRLAAALRSGLAASVVVAVGLLAVACGSSSSTAASSSSLVTNTTTTGPSTKWSTTDIVTRVTLPLPAGTATSGDFYAWSPDRSKVAFNPCCGWDTPVETAKLDGTDVHTVSANGLDGVGVQWSPDSSHLVYQQRDGAGNDLGNLVVYDVATGRQRRVTNLDHKQWGWWFLYPSLSPDGKTILYQRPGGHLANNDNRSWNLWSVPVTGGAPTVIQRNAAWGSYSPGGKRIAYLSRLSEKDFSGAKLWVRNVQGGRPRLLVRGGSMQWPRWSPDGTSIAYSNGSAVYLVDVATGETTKVARGGQPEWLDNSTLIIQR